MKTSLIDLMWILKAIKFTKLCHSVRVVVLVLTLKKLLISNSCDYFSCDYNLQLSSNLLSHDTAKRLNNNSISENKDCN